MMSRSRGDSLIFRGLFCRSNQFYIHPKRRESLHQLLPRQLGEIRLDAFGGILQSLAAPLRCIANCVWCRIDQEHEEIVGIHCGDAVLARRLRSEVGEIISGPCSVRARGPIIHRATSTVCGPCSACRCAIVAWNVIVEGNLAASGLCGFYFRVTQG